jgi:hypothetical protein
MTAPAAYLVNTGRHRPPSRFRLSLRLPWRKPAVPGVFPAPGAVPVLGCLPVDGVLGERMLSEIRRDWNARPMSADMPTGEFASLDAKVDAIRRPVNGVYRGTQPRRTPAHPPTVPVPVYGQACQLDVDRAETVQRLEAARDAARAARRCAVPSVELLEAVKAGLERVL